MKVKKKFLQLTRYTYPHGTENFLSQYLPSGYQVDKFNNFFLKIGDNPSCMFTCHLDTASSKQERVNHVIKNNMVHTDGKTILGADDKAGMIVLLYMIEKNVPGVYYFFIGEEVGCVGSSKVAQDWHNNELSSHIDKVISFDRRGTSSVITHQLYGRCCSDEFAIELSKRINQTKLDIYLTPDGTGIFTDSAKFMGIIPECTNISVGYYLEHTNHEYQDIDFLQRLCRSVCKINWDSLPICRSIDGDQEAIDLDSKKDSNEFCDKYFSYFSFGKQTKKMFISKSIIQKEKKLIYNWIKNQGWPDVKRIIWNGNSLNVQTASGSFEFIGNRFELSEYLPELFEISTSYLADEIDI